MMFKFLEDCNIDSTEDDTSKIQDINSKMLMQNKCMFIWNFLSCIQNIIVSVTRLCMGGDLNQNLKIIVQQRSKKER